MGVLAAAEFFQTNSVQLYALGAKYSDALGRSWRYALNGGVALSAGKLNVEATTVANHNTRSFTTAPAIGDTVVNVTIGATAMTANQYRGGTLAVISGTGLAQSYGIAANSASAGSGNVVITLTEPIRIAGAISESNVDLAANPYSGAVISVADQADIPVGVNPVAVTIAYYCFIQTGGQGTVLMDEVVAAGQLLTIGSSTVGAVEAQDAAGEPIVGMMGPLAGADGEYDVVSFTLDTPDR